MTRQSISLTEPNEAWLQTQVGKGKEYTSKSEAVNAVIRKARAEQETLDAIRLALIEAERGGFVEDTNPERMLTRIKNRVQRERQL
jgi:antitoxin ParD1/3/4